MSDERPASAGARFLYDSLTDQVLNPNAPRMLLLVGGAGTGKSVVLDRLAAHDSGALLIRGEEGREASIEALQTAITEDRSVFIDDLDDLFDARFRDLLYELVRHGTARIRATSTFPADLAYQRGRGAYSGVPWSEDMVQSWSDLLMSFANYLIDPWSIGWKRRVLDLVSRTVPEHATGWAVAVLHLTGGQPVMLDAALAYLSTLDKVAAPSGVPIEDILAEEWLRRTAQMEEHLLATGFKRLRRAVAEMAAGDPKAAERLHAIAGNENNPQISDAVRRSLAASGLVYRPSDRPFTPAGEILRRYLTGDDTTRYPTVETDGDAHHGQILITIGTETTPIPLRGKNWSLARVLGRTRGERVPLDQLQEEAHIEKPALRSAIQRLKTEIERAGFDGIIQNVWSEGYRLSTFPLLQSQMTQ